MRTAEEVLKYIDMTYARMLQRPRKYASDPSSLEQLFYMLEDIRAFIMNDSCKENTIQRTNKFGEFVAIRGHGVAMYTTRLEEEDADLNDREDRHFNALCNFIREYLAQTRPDFDPDDPATLDGPCN